jgi:hypothetical protein
MAIQGLKLEREWGKERRAKQIIIFIFRRFFPF